MKKQLLIILYTHIISLPTAFGMMHIEHPEYGTIQVYESEKNIIALAQKRHLQATVFQTCVKKTKTGQYCTDSYQLQPGNEALTLSSVMPQLAVVNFLKGKITEYEKEQKVSSRTKVCQPKPPLNAVDKGRSFLKRSN
ncbi:MAG: hypothetical protein AB7F19_04050 [Candidatus Babeliales bacterium]